MTVTALLVSHDGARWLPAVLDGLEAQTRRPDRMIAVDTLSKDASVDILQSRLGAERVVSAGHRSSFGAAVRAALGYLPPATEDEWVWLLHDDSAPAPDALEALLEAARDHPTVSVLGPKLREWPSLRRLLEVGVTISGTGRRESGLERGEYDQGQHDGIRQVLAVNTAGMLVRRTVLEQLGFDDRLPAFGNDIDFGWRAARAGYRTLVVPDAVVFHVEAAHRGLRRTPVTTFHLHRAERSAALYTLLVNSSAAALPFQVVRLFLGSLVRAFGLLLVRAPREAYDELAALAATYVRPGRVTQGRAERRRTARLPQRAVRQLLAPPWLPYRHGLDFVGDIIAAVVSQAEEASARRAMQRAGARETGPVPEEAQSLPDDTGLLARLLTSPVAWGFAVLTVLALVATRGALGAGMLSGGALLPAPDTGVSWWRVYLAPWHEVGVGSAAPAGPYLLPLAIGASFLLGKAWLLLNVLFFLAGPLSAFGALRFLRRLTATTLPAEAGPVRTFTARKAPELWGAVAYGLVPVLSGAVNQGRLGTVAAAVVLPWLAHSALFLAPSHSVDRRWRAAWRTSLWLAVLAAFVPLAWLVSLVLAGLVVAAGGQRWRSSSAWGPVAVAVGFVPVMLLPWSLLTLPERGALSWLLEAGLPAPSLLAPLTPLEVVAGRAADLGAAPAWLSLGVALAAVAALLRRDTRGPVLTSWAVLLVALLTVAALSGVTFDLPGSSSPGPLWLGFPLLLAQAAGITAATVAATDLSTRFSGSSFGWRQPLGLVVVAAAVLSPLSGAVWWAVTGVSEPLDRRAVHEVPAYMVDAARDDDLNGVLIIRGSRHAGFEYSVLRGDGQRTGDDTLVPTEEAQAPLTELVGNLTLAAEAADIEALSGHGVEFVYAPRPVDPVLAGNLDSVSGVVPASALRPGSRAWQVEAKPTDDLLPYDPSLLHPWLAVVQFIAVLVAAVSAAPTRRVRR